MEKGKPSPIIVDAETEADIKQKAIKKMEKRIKAFKADLIEVEKKHGLKLIAQLSAGPTGIIPNMIAVDPTLDKRFETPQMRNEDITGKKRK